MAEEGPVEGPATAFVGGGVGTSAEMAAWKPGELTRAAVDERPTRSIGRWGGAV